MYVGQLYAVQQGLQQAKGNPSAKSYLLHIMDQLEAVRFRNPFGEMPRFILRVNENVCVDR